MQALKTAPCGAGAPQAESSVFSAGGKVLGVAQGHGCRDAAQVVVSELIGLRLAAREGRTSMANKEASLLPARIWSVRGPPIAREHMPRTPQSTSFASPSGAPKSAHSSIRG